MPDASPRAFFSRPRRFLPAAPAALAALLAAAPLGAWTPDTQRAAALEAARLAPPGLAGQLERHARELQQGAVEPFSDSDPERHFKNPDGSGKLDAALLEELLTDPFLARRPPKSTGRERYGIAEAEALARRFAGAPDDLVATLVEFSAVAVARATQDFLSGAPERLLVGGGGAKNPALMAALARNLPGVRVDPTEAAGVPAAAAEAMAFSLLARNALLGIPNHLPQCTGSTAARVLGEIALGNGPLAGRALKSSA